MIILIGVVTGCKSENPTPELMDPIYSDLKKDAEDAKRELEAAKKELEDARIAVEKAEPNSMGLRDAEKKYWKADDKIKRFEVAARYFSIRMERRRLEGRRDYRKAFNQDKEWPDPTEYSEYLINKRLRAASRNWNTRVPKLKREVAAAPKKEEAKTEKEE